MKKFAKYLLTLGIAALSFAACEDEPLVEPVKYTIGGDSTFKDFQATVKVTADKAADVDVTVDIKLDATSTFTAEMLSFPATVKVAKGDTEASATVKITNPNALRPGEYKAVFSAAIEGVDLAEKVTITFSKADLSGQWSVIGSFAASDWKNDVAMTAGEGGWYAVEGVEIAAGDAFKFRRDGDWAVAFGLEATAVVPLDQEFDVTTKGGENTDIKIENEGIYTLSLNPNAAKAKVSRTGDVVKTLTLAQLAALMPAENDATADFKGVLNDVIVTYVAGSNVFLEDATGALLLYQKNTPLQAGVTLSGYFEGKIKNYSNLPEISEIKYNQEDVTMGTGEVPAPAEMTIAEVLANFDKLISRRVKIVNAYAGADIQKKGGYSIYQGENSIPFYVNVDLQKGFKAGSILDVVAIVTPYRDAKQLKIFEEGAITRLIPKMTMSDIQALYSKDQTANAEFAGVFDGLYVNYILGSNHVYLEDASGALRYYTASATTLKVGDKISGVITGSVAPDGGDKTRPTINWLDTKYGKVEAAPAEELPKPVTGTLNSFTDVTGLMYRRVYLEDVVLENDIKNGLNTISDATGTFQLNVRFNPTVSVPKGSKVSGYGTFDINYGKFEIRIFAQKDVTKVTPPEPKPALERLWGVYSGEGALWTANVQAISITHPDGYGMARSIAMDDQYIYFPKSSGYAAVGAVSITNPQDQKAGNVSGISGGSTFVTSFARMIKNTDASVNGGKDILLVCNLTETKTDAAKLVVYAYKDGFSSAPSVLCAFCYDACNDTNDWRRYGDRFFVTGTWQEGKLYFPSFHSNKTVVLSVANGARTAVTQIAAGADNSPEGIKDLTVYPGTNTLFITNASVANLVAPTGNTVSNGWLEYALSGSSEKAKGTWGYNFFAFNGKNYIAYARIDGKKAWIEVIEDNGDLLSSLEAQAGLIKSPIHDAKDLDKELATGGLADCQVREINGTVYVVAITRDGGAVVNKMVLK